MPAAQPSQELEDDYIVGEIYAQLSYGRKGEKCFSQLAIERDFKSVATEKLGLKCTQMSLEAGLNARGEAAEKAVVKEFVQFHEKDTLRLNTCTHCPHSRSNNHCAWS